MGGAPLEPRPQIPAVSSPGGSLVGKEEGAANVSADSCSAWWSRVRAGVGTKDKCSC